jgi:hypothetical protein
MNLAGWPHFDEAMATESILPEPVLADRFAPFGIVARLVVERSQFTGGQLDDEYRITAWRMCQYFSLTIPCLTHYRSLYQGRLRKKPSKGSKEAHDKIYTV